MRIIFTSFRSDFFQLKIKEKTKVQNSTTIVSIQRQFEHIEYDMIHALEVKEKIGKTSIFLTRTEVSHLL